MAQPVGATDQITSQRGGVGDGDLGGGRRGGRAPVCGPVGHGGVGLVADAGDHRDARGANRPGQRFALECPEVLERASAAHQQDHVDADGFLRPSQRVDDGTLRAVALHRCR